MNTAAKNSSVEQTLTRPMDEVYQLSTMTSLLDGVYESDMTFAELKKFGNFGIGTFNHLDGELIAFDNEFYQLKDGTARRVRPEDSSPFCSLTHFTTDITYKVDGPLTRPELEELIKDLVRSENLFYAIRVDGVFKQMNTRTVSYQEKPVPMTEAVKSQPVYSFEDIKGTLAGFWTPIYAQGIAVAGFHFHFIDDGRTGGGHVFDYVLDYGTIQISKKTHLNLQLPETEGFLNANLSRANLADELEKTEG
ncbi:alpha-acetolactate decarboxylase [Weizmannia acidilactici]|uniref:Alpha-acetolactate decarboxylase n=1 Tax=Weizmannia acidilactici TaxID=2607726 RepID=A0A5J4JL48_9BACI|nr:acetolactate decarboxylase [Weizmannia acidilactici]GER67204.1 alpha-acetolactate decarboxylase [Weizmannia acidilactici]GER69714.1 alpha-acetolactate decarboxylase [Weizmannia acidilactici]GER72465.1 alpha-acetolactate decarboxylase [Weizmannia acidilactici]